MKTKKQFTAKKGYPVLTVTDELGFSTEVIRKPDGTFRVQTDGSNKVNPTERNVWPDGDEPGFLNAYHAYLKSKEEKQAERLAVEQAKIKEEEARIEDIRKRAKECEDLYDFENAFGIDLGSMSDGRNRGRCIMIKSREDAEVIGLAIEEGVLKGEWGECHSRQGNVSHGREFTSRYGMDTCEKYSSLTSKYIGDKNFYHDQETEEEVVLEKLKSVKDIDEARKILREYDELEPGYYGCGGDLIISNAQLDDPDFCGYSEDVHTYEFAFKVDEAASFPKTEFVIEVLADGLWEGYVNVETGKFEALTEDASVFDVENEAAEAMQSFATSEAAKGKEWSFKVVGK